MHFTNSSQLPFCNTNRININYFCVVQIRNIWRLLCEIFHRFENCTFKQRQSVWVNISISEYEYKLKVFLNIEEANLRKKQIYFSLFFLSSNFSATHVTKDCVQFNIMKDPKDCNLIQIYLYMND